MAPPPYVDSSYLNRKRAVPTPTAKSTELIETHRHTSIAKRESAWPAADIPTFAERLALCRVLPIAAERFVKQHHA
jgi:hypothetical protein